MDGIKPDRSHSHSTHPTPPSKSTMGVRHTSIISNPNEQPLDSTRKAASFVSKILVAPKAFLDALAQAVKAKAKGPTKTIAFPAKTASKNLPHRVAGASHVVLPVTPPSKSR